MELSPRFPHSSVRSFSIAAKLEAPDNVLQLPGHITLGLTIINKRGESELEEDFEYKMKQNLGNSSNKSPFSSDLIH